MANPFWRRIDHWRFPPAAVNWVTGQSQSLGATFFGWARGPFDVGMMTMRPHFETERVLK